LTSRGSRPKPLPAAEDCGIAVLVDMLSVVWLTRALSKSEQEAANEMRASFACAKRMSMGRPAGRRQGAEAMRRGLVRAPAYGQNGRRFRGGEVDFWVVLFDAFV
jgi:hypothetical protein